MNAKWITPVVTAFDAEGHVDLEANKRIYEHLIQGGMDGILILEVSVSSSPFLWKKRKN